MSFFAVDTLVMLSNGRRQARLEQAVDSPGCVSAAVSDSGVDSVVVDDSVVNLVTGLVADWIVYSVAPFGFRTSASTTLGNCDLVVRV